MAVVFVGLLATACLNTTADTPTTQAASDFFGDIPGMPHGYVDCVAAGAASENPGDLVAATAGCENEFGVALGDLLAGLIPPETFDNADAAACIEEAAQQLPLSELQIVADRSADAASFFRDLGLQLGRSCGAEAFASLSQLGPDRTELLGLLDRIDEDHRWEAFLADSANGLAISGLYTPESTIAFYFVEGEPTALLARLEFAPSSDLDVIRKLVAALGQSFGIDLNPDEIDDLLSGSGSGTSETAETCASQSADEMTVITVVVRGVPCR